MTSIRPVPKWVHGYAVYRRYPPEASSMQKVRRYAKRHNVPYDEALKLFQQGCRGKKIPFVQMHSETNQQKYRLYIERILQDLDKVVGFGSYGLDNQSPSLNFDSILAEQ